MIIVIKETNPISWEERFVKYGFKNLGNLDMLFSEVIKDKAEGIRANPILSKKVVRRRREINLKHLNW